MVDSEKNIVEDVAEGLISVKKSQISYSSVVQNKEGMKKVDLEVEEIDGMMTARIPDSVFEEAQPLWEDFLVGKFLAKAPFVGGIHALVNKIWTLGDKTVRIDVFVVDNTTVRFRIKDVRTRERILRRGMWNLCGVPVVLSKWSPIAEAEQEEIKTIPLWVIVKNVPAKYFSWKVLSAITSPLGLPKKLHPDTKACKSLEEAKVLVEVDLTKKLPKFFSFKSEKGGDTVVEFVYPWLPPRCTECSKWGHLSPDCKSVKKKKGDESRIVSGLEMTEEPSDKTENKEKGESSMDHKSETKVVEEPDRIQDGEEPGWLTPSKTGKSPKQSKELKYGEVSIMSNTFSCLSDKGEKGEEIEINVVTTQTTEHVAVGNTEATRAVIPNMGKEGDNTNVPKGIKEGVLRQSLPRISKDEHKCVSTNGTQSIRGPTSKAVNTRHSKKHY